MERYPLLFNPNARSQRGKRALSFVMKHATRFALYATKDADDATELAAKFAQEGYPIIIAAGGDGTLNAVVQGLAGSETALGVLPTGTMNVFARELGIPVPNLQQSNLDKALAVIDEGFIKHVDLFHANQAPFVQMAGVGFDAQVIEETTWEAKKMIGPMAYLMSAVRVLGENPTKMKVITDQGRTEEGVAVLAGNGSLYGGQVKLFNQADNGDNLVDILIFKESGYKLLLDSMKGLATGEIQTGKSSVTYLQAESFKVICDAEVPVQVDGEWSGRSEVVHFRPSASKLRVLAPENPTASFAQSLVEWVQTISKLDKDEQQS